jgi:hypothetical protein
MDAVCAAVVVAVVVELVAVQRVQRARSLVLQER